MTLFKFSIKFFITAIPILFIFARIVPRFLIQNNIEKLAGGEAQAVDYAEEVLRIIGHGHCSQLAALTCTGVKIMEFKRLKITPSNNKQSIACRYPYKGKAVVYGLFGIPLQEIKFGCDLVESYPTSGVNDTGLILSQQQIMKR